MTPFKPAGHPATKELLETLLPNKRVKSFSIHFPLDGVATLQAEILLNAEDMKALIEVTEVYELKIEGN